MSVPDIPLYCVKTVVSQTPIVQAHAHGLECPYICIVFLLCQTVFVVSSLEIANQAGHGPEEPISILIHG